MLNSNFLLIGILVGTFPTLQSPVIPLNKKMVPAIFSFLVMAVMDWSDWGVILFLVSAVVINWIYQRDVLNWVVDKMMQMIIEAKDKTMLKMMKAKDKITNAIDDVVHDKDDNLDWIFAQTS